MNNIRRKYDLMLSEVGVRTVESLLDGRRSIPGCDGTTSPACVDYPLCEG